MSVESHDNDGGGGVDLRDVIAAPLTAMRAVLPVVVIAAALLPVGMNAMQPAIVAADKLIRAESAHWQNAIMPAVLFGIYGLIFGAALGWRMSAGASVDGLATLVLGVASILIVLATGAVAAGVIFTSGVPEMCWYCLGGLGGAAALGAYLVSVWLG